MQLFHNKQCDIIYILGCLLAPKRLYLFKFLGLWFINLTHEVTNLNDVNPYFVCVGASAGGLEVIKAFFKSLPSQTGLVWVVIQHLSPKYKSMMKELLASSSDMPIQMAEQGMQPQPDNVYLIPPGVNLVIKPDGLFSLADQHREKAGLNLPIDIFFESLADYAGDHAIAVILSGTGSDGTRGARRIRERGGLVLAQNFLTAKFNGMPKSIVDNGLADFCDDVERLPGHILRYATHPYEKLSPELTASDENVQIVSKLFDVVRERSRIDFSAYNESTVERRIERRISMSGHSSMSEYLEYLIANPDETDDLINDLLIGVTNFFRDRSVIEDKLRLHLTELMLQTTHKDLRFWVAGCSSGEEAYTLVMLFNDICEQESLSLSLKVFATDIDPDAIGKASAGNYSSSISNDVPPEYLSRFFQRTAEGFTVARRVREQVVFAKHDVLNDPPFTRIDLISCRNMLIYLKPSSQSRVFDSFSFSLRPGGLLFLGPSETLGENDYMFEELDKNSRIYRSVDSAKRTRFNREIPLYSDTREYLHRVQSTKSKRSAQEARLANELKIYESLIDSLGNTELIPFGLLVDQNQNLLRILGSSKQYFKPLSGRIESQVSKLLIKEVSLPTSAAISRSLKSGKTVTVERLIISSGDLRKLVSLRVFPISVNQHNFTHALVVLNEEGEVNSLADAKLIDLNVEDRNRILVLEHELQISQKNLQSLIEDLETSNEELQATNEETLANDEELQSTNQELQSVNEELFTLNHEHNERLIEMSRLRGQFDSLLQATNLSAIFIDDQFCLQSYTPGSVRVFNIIDRDIGYPIAHISHQLPGLDIRSVCAEVLEHGDAFEKNYEVDVLGRCNLRVLPRLDSSSNRIGIIILLSTD